MAAIVVLLSAGPAGAAPGDLDPSFGIGGIREIDFVVTDLAVQDDGRIVVVAGIGRWTVARLLADGTSDPAFAGTGEAASAFPGGVGGAPQAVLIQPDGKIVVGGSAGTQAALVRYLPDGSLDNSFSGDGIELSDLGDGTTVLNDVALASHGKIVVAASTGPGFPSGASDRVFTLARYLPEGGLDPTFGDQGVVQTAFDGFEGGEAIALAIEPGGTIAAAGRATYTCCYNQYGGFLASELALARYMSDGSLDASFGDGGKVSPGRDSGRASANDVVSQADGKLVVAAGVDSTAALARFDASGALDPSFAGSGVALGPITAYSPGPTLALEPDGHIALVGLTHTRKTQDDFAIARFNGDGTRDTGFGEGGAVSTDLGGRHQELRTIAAQPDGKLVAGGISALIRYVVAPGRPDADADGVLDGDDECPQAYGPGPSGCERYVREVTTPGLRNSRLPARELPPGPPGPFVGELQSPDHLGCSREEEVGLFRERRGPDRRLRATVTKPNGSLVIGYRTPRKGRYYLKAPASTHSNIGRCQRDRSPVLRLERHQRIVKNLQHRDGSFVGRLSARAPRCVENQRVKLMRHDSRLAESSRVRVGRARTNARGRMKLAVSGDGFYAVVAPRNRLCEAVKSDLLEIRG